MSELFLVRHAQASYGSDNYDCLSDLGHQQAVWLGEYFRYRNLSFDHVVCGSQQRHRQTLDNVARGMELSLIDPFVNDQWNEFDFETLIRAYVAENPGKQPPGQANPADFMQVLKQALIAWSVDEVRGPVSESWVAFEQRTRLALEQIMEQTGSGKKVLVVSSGGAISMVLRHILEAPTSAMIQMNLQTRNSGFSHAFFNSNSISLAGFNHVPHLDHPERVENITYY